MGFSFVTSLLVVCASTALVEAKRMATVKEVGNMDWNMQSGQAEKNQQISFDAKNVDGYAVGKTGNVMEEAEDDSLVSLDIADAHESVLQENGDAMEEADDDNELSLDSTGESASQDNIASSEIEEKGDEAESSEVDEAESEEVDEGLKQCAKGAGICLKKNSCVKSSGSIKKKGGFAHVSSDGVGGTVLRSGTRDCKNVKSAKSVVVCCKTTEQEVNLMKEKRDAEEESKRNQEKAKEDKLVSQVLPSKAETGEALFQTWLSNAVLKVAQGRTPQGNSRTAMNAIHTITFQPGFARFPNTNKHVAGETCDLYPQEVSSKEYSTFAKRAKTDCDTKSMRAADLDATDNPVKPMIDCKGNIFTLWEARHNYDEKAHVFCPSLAKMSGRKNVWKESHKAVLSLGVPSQGAKCDVFPVTYGGEAEVKKVRVRVNGGAPKPIDTYGKHLLMFKKDGKPIVRLEGECASGAGLCFAEIVTYPVDISAVNARENLVQPVYEAMKKAQKGNLPDLAAKMGKTLGKPWTVEFLADDPKLPADKTEILNLDTVLGTSTICQGNYMVPLQNVALGKITWTNDYSESAFGQSLYWAEKIVLALTGSSSIPDMFLNLKGTLAIYIYGMHWFHLLKSSGDTIKDNFDQLPKTPVVDLVRSLSMEEKTALFEWVKV